MDPEEESFPLEIARVEKESNAESYDFELMDTNLQGLEFMVIKSYRYIQRNEDVKQDLGDFNYLKIIDLQMKTEQSNKASAMEEELDAIPIDEFD